jgi:LPXTG-motif cell wall-anchored protein
VALPLAVPSPTSAGPAVVDQAGAPPTADGSSGSPAGLIVGIIAVVALAGAGGLTAWRRRQASP